MYPSSPRAMALIIAFITAIIGTLGVSLGKIIHADYYVFFTVLTFAAIFITVFLVAYFLLRRFIFKKINPIYKTIHTSNLSWKDFDEEGTGESDIISNLSRDVINWAVNRNHEIAQLRQMEKYRREFLGNVSHELKTPLFNIQGYVLTLLDGGLDDPSVNKTYLEKSEKNINRMISIVEDLEAISRLESHEMELQFEEFNLIPLIEEVFEMQEVRAQNMQITLTLDHRYERPVKVNADRKRIMEVLNNLIVNSIHYGNPGGKTTISLLDAGNKILVKVTDTGIGIEEKHLNRIFERFYRVDKSRSRDLGGTGLGLSIVKHILEAHGESVNVQSTPGAGSTFSFTLQKA